MTAVDACDGVLTSVDASGVRSLNCAREGLGTLAELCLARRFFRFTGDEDWVRLLLISDARWITVARLTTSGCRVSDQTGTVLDLKGDHGESSARKKENTTYHSMTRPSSRENALVFFKPRRTSSLFFSRKKDLRFCLWLGSDPLQEFGKG